MSTKGGGGTREGVVLGVRVAVTDCSGDALGVRVAVKVAVEDAVGDADVVVDGDAAALAVDVVLGELEGVRLALTVVLGLEVGLALGLGLGLAVTAKKEDSASSPRPSVANARTTSAEPGGRLPAAAGTTKSHAANAAYTGTGTAAQSGGPTLVPACAA